MIFIFAPYIKTGFLSELLDGLQSRVVIVTTWKPTDIQLGSSELSLYPYCREHGIALYVNNSMHLKVYSAGLGSAVLATGNVSHRGLMPGGNHEAGTLLEHLTNEDRLFFEKIRREARLVNDIMYGKLKRWIETNPIESTEQVDLEDVVPAPKKDDFLISALPMTRSVDELVAGYAKISSDEMPSDNPETAGCIFHDLANYGIETGLPEAEFVQMLTSRFFAHPFIQRVDEFINPEAYFGRIKKWIQGNCADVPIPSRRELTGNVQVLLEWFVALGDGRYVVDVPETHSQRIRKL